MKRLFLSLLLLSFSAQAQTFQWLQVPSITFGMNAGMIGYPSACDASGNVLMAGFKENAVPYGSDILGSLMFNKYDGSAQLLFSKTFSGQAAAYLIATDNNGNSFMTLGYRNSISIGDLTLLTVNQGIQPLLVKFDSQGNLLWHYEPVIEGGFVEHMKAITTDEAGNCYIGFDDYSSSWIHKISPEGTVLSTIVQSGVKIISSLSVDNAGNIYTAGSCAEPWAAFAGIAAPVDLQYNTYVAKYSPSGQFQWVRYVDDVTCPDPQVKARTPDAVYFCSYLFGSYDFDGIVTEGPVGSSFSDFFLAKLNASGTYQWVREVPGAGEIELGNRNYLNVDSQGNVYWAGSTRWTTNWGNNITTSVSGFSHDALVLKYNPEGTLLMAKTAGGNSQDRMDGITITTAGDIYVSGMVSGNATFDALQHMQDGNGYRPFVAKMETMLGANEPETSIIQFYPSPASEAIFVTNANGPAALYSLLGQKIRDIEIRAGEKIPVSDLASGIYILKPQGKKALRFQKN